MQPLTINAQCPEPPSSTIGENDARGRARLLQFQADWRQKKKEALLECLRGKAFGNVTGWDPETGIFRYQINSLPRDGSVEHVQAAFRRAGFQLLNGSASSQPFESTN